MTAYDKYQLEWMIAHGHSIRDLVEALGEYNADRLGKYAIEPELLWAWENDNGFNGEIWACYDEWLECEGKEETEQNERMGAGAD